MRASNTVENLQGKDRDQAVYEKNQNLKTEQHGPKNPISPNIGNYSSKQS